MDEVTRASNILECSDMEVFRKAYRLWFGTYDNEHIEVDYHDYMQLGFMPMYVRWFCRKVQEPPDDGVRRFIRQVAKLLGVSQ